MTARTGSWPAELRALSFAITFGVVILESVPAAAVVILVWWLAGGTVSAGVLGTIAIAAAALALGIATYAHARPQRGAFVRQIR
jgi:hypothetical protein